MPSDLQVTNIKANDGTAGISIANSSGNVSLSGTLSSGTIGSSVTGFGLLTDADQWRLTTNFTTQGVITGAHVERNNTVFEKIGTGVSYDSSTGVFTFPNTGIWWVVSGAVLDSNSGAENYGGIATLVSTTGVSGTFTQRAYAYNGLHATSSFGSTFSSLILDVNSITSSTAVAVQFRIDTQSTDVRLRGSATVNLTHFTFIRLGDT